MLTFVLTWSCSSQRSYGRRDLLDARALARKSHDRLRSYSTVPHLNNRSSRDPPFQLQPELQNKSTRIASQSNKTMDISPPKREPPPSGSVPVVSIPHKRILEDDHQPAISSPLNPDFKSSKTHDDGSATRERRAKKESLKKRESKGSSLAADNARASPDPKSKQKYKKGKTELAPLRYKLWQPKTTHFEAPRGPILTPFETKKAPDGADIDYNETSDQ